MEKQVNSLVPKYELKLILAVFRNGSYVDTKVLKVRISSKNMLNKYFRLYLDKFAFHKKLFLKRIK